MTVTALTSLGMMLERVRLMLEGRPDLEAEGLRHDVRNAISGVRWLETKEAIETLAHWRDHAAELSVRGRQIIEQARAYADERRLRFLQIDSPCPERSDTIVMSLAEIRERMAGADEPPFDVLDAIIDAQTPKSHRSGPPPPPDDDFTRFVDEDDSEE